MRSLPVLKSQPRAANSKQQVCELAGVVWRANVLLRVVLCLGKSMCECVVCEIERRVCVWGGADCGII